MEDKPKYTEIKNENIKLYVKEVKYQGMTYSNLVIRVKEYNEVLNEYEVKELLVNNKTNYKYIYHLLMTGQLK